MLALDDAIRKANSGGLEWLVGRNKADVKNIMDKWIIVEHVHIGPSKFYQGKENAIIAVVGQDKTFYRVNSDVVVRKLQDVEAALKADNLPWTEVAIHITEKQSPNNRYYDLEVCRANEIPAGQMHQFPGVSQQSQPWQQQDAAQGGRRPAPF